MPSMHWKWDKVKIQSQTSVANNIQDLMQQKLSSKLGTKPLQVLKLAACLGASFEEAILCDYHCHESANRSAVRWD
jgi:predicted ATPase